MGTKTSTPFPGATDFQGEDDHRTLMRGEEIKNDPARMKGVKKHHRKQKKALSQVQQSMLSSGRR
jgi:hypothetical protein